MFRLPRPQTFPDGQRSLFGAALIGAGIFCGIGMSGVILLLWQGGWSLASEAQRIKAIALMGAGFPLGMVLVMIAMAIGGPVGRYKVSASRSGVDIEADAHGETPSVEPTAAPSGSQSSPDGAEGPHVE